METATTTMETATMTGVFAFAALMAVCRLQAEEQLEVRVRNTPAGPQIQVDGESVAPRICWSFDNPKRRPVDGTWRRRRFQK